jgi:ubiquinol-cytochrome c reductase cytochrome b subunit
VLHGRETGRIVRLPHGEYIEVHEPLDKYEMYKLVDFKDYKPTIVRPNEKGKITVGSRIRSSLSRIYFEDRISPVSKTELEKAQSHDQSPAIEATKQDQLSK